MYHDYYDVNACCSILDKGYIKGWQIVLIFVYIGHFRKVNGTPNYFILQKIRVNKGKVRYQNLITPIYKCQKSNGSIAKIGKNYDLIL